MQLSMTVIQLVVAGTVIAATELTIFWNKIRNVNSVDTAGQIIPLAIGSIAIFRPLYLRLRGRLEIPDLSDTEDPVADEPAARYAIPFAQAGPPMGRPYDPPLARPPIVHVARPHDVPMQFHPDLVDEPDAPFMGQGGHRRRGRR